MDYTLAQDEEKTDSKVKEPKTSSKTKELHLAGDTLVIDDKGSAKKGGSTKSTIKTNESTIKPDESTIKKDESIVKPDEGTDKPDECTDKQNEGTDRQIKGTAEYKDSRESATKDSRESATPTAPTTTSTPTPIVFSDDETITQVLVTMSQNKVKQKEKEKGVELKNVEDIKRPRPTSTRSEAEEEKKRLADEEATKAVFTNEYDFIQARLNADKILTEKLQDEEREKFTIEERAKLLHDTTAAQRRFLAQQRSEVKRTDENFISISSVEDERLIKDLNKKVAGIKNAKNIKEENKEEEGTKKRKLGIRKKMKSRKKRFRQDTSEDDETNSEKENDELRLCLTIAPDEDKEVDYEILDKKYPIIEWKSKYLGIKPQYDETKDLKEINLNVVIRSNGQRRYFSTLMRVLSIFDREDLSAVYQLMMDRYQDEIPKDFDKLKIHGSSGVHTLMTEAGLVIHMLVEKKYPLRKKVLLQMLELKLESEEDSTMALELIRFVKKLIAELEPKNSDGDEEDL
ncbi:hypothetical protein Tco_1570371 [Tanacetum coccineum]